MSLVDGALLGRLDVIQLEILVSIELTNTNVIIGMGPLLVCNWLNKAIINASTGFSIIFHA